MQRGDRQRAIGEQAAALAAYADSYLHARAAPDVAAALRGLAERVRATVEPGGRLHPPCYGTTWISQTDGDELSVIDLLDPKRPLWRTRERGWITTGRSAPPRAIADAAHEARGQRLTPPPPDPRRSSGERAVASACESEAGVRSWRHAMDDGRVVVHGVSGVRRGIVRRRGVDDGDR